jgi:uncharacterized protein YpmB
MIGLGIFIIIILSFFAGYVVAEADMERNKKEKEEEDEEGSESGLDPESGW